MSNTRSFSDFDSPDGSTPLGTNEAGVLLTDTLEDLREKTNGIVEKVNTIAGAFALADGDITTAYVAADNLIKAGALNVNALAIDKIVKTTARRLLGNVQETDTDVTEIPIAVSSGYNDSPASNIYGIRGENATTPGVHSIPTSNAIVNYVDERDAAAIAAVKNALYPVGSIYTNAVDSENPSTLLGFGTWAAFGAGRVAVGIDSSDTDFDTAEETGGDKTHALDTTEMPLHHHTYSESSSGPAAKGVGSGMNPATSVGRRTVYTGGIGGDLTTNLTVPHNNVQPYITVHMWKRTA